MFQKWRADPSKDIHNRNKQLRNKVSGLGKARRKTISENLEKNPIADTILKSIKAFKKQQCTNLPNLETLNQFFVSARPTLSTRLNACHQPSSLNRNKNKLTLQQTDLQEEAKIQQKMENKSSGPDGISNQIIESCSPVIESCIAFAFAQCIL